MASTLIFKITRSSEPGVRVKLHDNGDRFCLTRRVSQWCLISRHEPTRACQVLLRTTINLAHQYSVEMNINRWLHPRRVMEGDLSQW
jgi:hypothetical protein